MTRLRIKIVGQSGMGLLSVGEMLIDAFNELGLFVVCDREYPSLIKGGYSCFTINVSDERIFSLSEFADVMVAIDNVSLNQYFDFLVKDGVLIHGMEKAISIKQISEKAIGKNIKVININARETSKASGGSVLMQNTVLVGMAWKVLGIDIGVIETALKKRFEGKINIIETNLRCVKAGYDSVVSENLATGLVKKMSVKKSEKKFLIDGNKAIALGAINCGVRAYFSYPMSPSSTILSYLAEMSGKTDMIIKQAEDEITAAQMALGAMHMGTRAFAATSGGGYDLMTETVSLAGMLENPLVIVVGQRPGPATGLPTWTMQGDLNLAVFSSHGEFPRIVLAVSDPIDAFYLIQHAFNFAEKFQIPVIVLSEKTICEGKINVLPYDENAVDIERGLVSEEELKDIKREDRYALTETGVSKRWLSGDSEVYYFANGDEHFVDGSLTEEADEVEKMYEKRMRKIETIKKTLPKPEIFGEKNADISFVGWGSSKNVMIDTIAICLEKGVKVNYLHYSFVWPIDGKSLKDFFSKNKNVHLIEENYLGQFGNLAEAEIQEKFAGRLLKFNGRPFFVEDLIDYIDKNSKK